MVMLPGVRLIGGTVGGGATERRRRDGDGGHGWERRRKRALVIHGRHGSRIV